MTIDIGIKRSGRKYLLDPAEPKLTLRGAPFQYLQPLLKSVTYQTGQTVELDGFAVFEGNDLLVLAQALANLRPVIEAQPESWPVQVGTQLKPTYEEFFETVTRQEMLDVLTHWQIVVDRAQELNRAVLCVGD